MGEAREYPIQPTAPQVTEQYSDISLTGLFNAHTAIINSERQAIWQRYNVLLLANAVIFGFLSGAGRTTTEVLFGMSFGLSFCAVWWIITREGWRLLTTRRDKAAQFIWPALDREANPFEIGIVYERGLMGGRIYQMAVTVIALFVVGYVFLAVSRLW